MGWPSEGGGRDFRDGIPFTGAAHRWGGFQAGCGSREAASQHSCVVKGWCQWPEGKQGATGKLLFRNLNLTATMLRTRQQGKDHRGTRSAQHPTRRREDLGDEPEGNEKCSQSCLSLGGTGLAASQSEMLSQFGDFFQL